MFERTLIADRPRREMRQFPRIPLVVRVRLRWAGALGLETEVTETRDTGRGGMLVKSEHERRAGTPVWVTFPFNPDEADCLPEFPAHVAYSQFTASGDVRVGIAFDASHGAAAHSRHIGNGNGAGHNGNGSLWSRAKRAIFGIEERRRCERVALALAINVRREDSPWPDEAISVNLSAGGAEFCSRQIYEVGARIEVELPEGRWAVSGKHAARVLRVADQEGSMLQNVTVEFIVELCRLQGGLRCMLVLRRSDARPTLPIRQWPSFASESFYSRACGKT